MEKAIQSCKDFRQWPNDRGMYPVQADSLKLIRPVRSCPNQFFCSRVPNFLEFGRFVILRLPSSPSRREMPWAFVLRQFSLCIRPRLCFCSVVLVRRQSHWNFTLCTRIVSFRFCFDISCIIVHLPGKINFKFARLLFLVRIALFNFFSPNWWLTISFINSKFLFCITHFRSPHEFGTLISIITMISTTVDCGNIQRSFTKHLASTYFLSLTVNAVIHSNGTCCGVAYWDLICPFHTK